MPFNKLLSTGSYDFVTADKLGKKWLALFVTPWQRSGNPDPVSR